MNIPDHIFESLETIFGGLKIIKFFDADTQSFWHWIRDEKILIRYPSRIRNTTAE